MAKWFFILQLAALPTFVGCVSTSEVASPADNEGPVALSRVEPNNSKDLPQREGAALVIRPSRSAGLEYIREHCRYDYDIVAEGEPSAEIGIGIDIGKGGGPKPHWVITYRCKNIAGMNANE